MNIRKGLSLPAHLYDHYATLPNERLLLATRTHPYTVFFPAVGVGIGGIALLVLFATLLGNGYISLVPAIFVMALVCILAVVAWCILFLLWYSHYYIVTSRKMIEIRGFPLVFRTVNDVLLDQVRCTEIDIRRQGVIHTLLNMGDIILTFDRPTHQEEFTLAEIHDPDHVGLFLSDMLGGNTEMSAPLVWNKSLTGNNYRFTEEILPRHPPLTTATT